MYQQILLLAAAGALGALARWGLSDIANRLHGTGFPWGTLIVNAVGCLLFGLIWALAEDRLLIDNHARVVVLTGFMGAFTTFSTFIFETGELLRAAQWLLAFGNLTAQLGIGLLFLFAGLSLGRLM